eukprot:1157935-Pelagomonas_calceolata.AAC.2
MPKLLLQAPFWHLDAHLMPGPSEEGCASLQCGGDSWSFTFHVKCPHLMLVNSRNQGMVCENYCRPPAALLLEN